MDHPKPPAASLVHTQKMEYWREMRALIMHEDNLVNHRFSWLLTYEGFLMGGFFLLQSALLSNKASVSIMVAAELVLLPIMLASMWICFITGQTISAAYRQTAMVYETWVTHYKEERWQRSPVPRWFLQFGQDPHNEAIRLPPGSQFPPLLGKFTYHALGRTVRIPFILCMVNLLAAIGCIAIAGYAFSHRATASVQTAPTQVAKPIQPQSH
jgi:hypothetical protein